MPRSAAGDARRLEQSGAHAGLSVAAYERLKQAIVECELLPGSIISQTRLEVQYRLSRASIRSALARLQQERLVEPIPRHGYRIPPFTVQDIEEIFFLRELVEPVATGLAAGRLGRQGIAELRELNRVSFVPGDRASERRYIQANRGFHIRIAEASHNRRLLALIRQVHDDSTLMTFLTMSFRDFNAEWQRGHERIIEALERGDRPAAEQHSRAEITAGRECVLRTLLSNPAISSLNLQPSEGAASRAAE